ncbi:hypothetical protein [Hyphococcus sp.]|uniref:hypothetical protein n=1 Tax=Hyphococcus sp. TaxID=2038636 RepID=UPI0035C6E3C6
MPDPATRAILEAYRRRVARQEEAVKAAKNQNERETAQSILNSHREALEEMEEIAKKGA